MHDLLPAEVLRPSLVRFIEGRHADWSPTGFICLSDLNRFRTDYVKQVIEAEVGEISALENEVLTSLRERELLSTNIYAELDAKQTLGERLSDKIAMFGGSWRFIIVFSAILLVWIAANSLVLLWRPFDPYPFILLNLVLSTLAAVQAPIILMSQNRAAERDRQGAEHDYIVNLRAELEIMLLHDKLDRVRQDEIAQLLRQQRELVDALATPRSASPPK